MKRKYVNPDEIDQDWECAICMDVMINPVKTKCGHSFCKHCIVRYLKNRYEKACPFCRREVAIKDLKRNEELYKITENLLIRCPHSLCNWSGKFSDMLNHIKKDCNVGQMPVWL